MPAVPAPSQTPAPGATRAAGEPRAAGRAPTPGDAWAPSETGTPRLDPELLAAVAEEGAGGEQLGRLTGRTAGLLRDAGVMRLLQPASHGGRQAHPREFAETVMALAAADGAAGWVAGVVGVHPWELALTDPRAQAEVWGDDPDAWVASPYAPMGVARPVDGGYAFSGRWQFSSGTDHCDWVFLGGMLGDADGNSVQPVRTLHLLVPREDYKIVPDSWDVVGLRGTGSKDIAIDGAFVPEHRTLAYEDLVDGTAARAAGVEDPLYRLPFAAMFPLGITSAVVGMAEGVLAHHLAYQRGRVNITGTLGRDDPYALSAAGAAAAEIGAARASLLANISDLYDQVAAGRELSQERRAVSRRTQVTAAWRAVRAADEIVMRSGGNAMRSSQPIQRFWRDLHMGLVHVIHVPDKVLHGSTLVSMGVDLDWPQKPLF